jgi:putative ABC transport system permease protein
VAEAVAGIDGIGAVLEMPAALARVTDSAGQVLPLNWAETYVWEFDAEWVASNEDLPYEERPLPDPADIPQPQVLVVGADPDVFADVVADPQVSRALADGKAVTKAWALFQNPGAGPQTIAVSGPGGSRTYELVHMEDEWGNIPFIIPLDDLNAIVDETSPTGLWATVSPGADVVAVADDMVSVMTDFSDSQGEPLWVRGSAIETHTVSQIIEVIVIVLMALLGVAVLIALVGVANTLSLSVIERRRENGLLRALGLTRGQMRWMLALEGMSVAGIGAAIGIVLGVGLGWAGAYLIFSLEESPQLGLYPWQIAATFGISVLAGLIASILPGRRAARTPPAAALAME